METKQHMLRLPKSDHSDPSPMKSAVIEQETEPNPFTLLDGKQMPLCE